ncbi:MAG: DUF350 domain-containing protein [Candidatus Altiarchaeia archaeon]|jgi:uncharacterized membrane protein YjfL (UPF0719 family)
MDTTQMIMGVGIGVVQLIVGLILAIASIYIGLSMFGKFTKGIDEEEELKKGNVAVGILQAAIILSIANVVQSGVVGLTGALTLGFSVNAIIAGVIQLLVGIILAVVAIYMAINVLDKITKGIDEMAEIKKGNVAVAILMAGVLIAVSFVVQAGVSGIARAVGVAL